MHVQNKNNKKYGCPQSNLTDNEVGRGKDWKRNSPVENTITEERPWPEYAPSLALMAPWEEMAMPATRHRAAQKITLSRMDIFLSLMDRIEGVLGTTWTLVRSVWVVEEGTMVDDMNEGVVCGGEI